MRLIRNLLLCMGGLAALLSQRISYPADEATLKGECLMYVGTYTQGQESRGAAAKSEGIYVYRFLPLTGKLTRIGLAAATPNPSFLAVHPNHRFLYAVNEVSNYAERQGSVSAFSIDPATGKLTPLNTVSSRGSGPCHLSLDKTGKWLMAANYGSGSIALFPVRDDGGLEEATGFVQHVGSSVDPRRQKGPHAHCIVPSPDSRFAFAADLGLDRILAYRIDTLKGTLTPNDPPSAAITPGSGPRHIAFHPSGRFLYEISEMKPAVTAFAYDSARGSLAELQRIPLLNAAAEERGSGAELEVHPSGRFLYASIRGLDSLAVLAIDANGTLKLLERVPTQGKIPRHFAIDPTGSYLFAEHQNSDSVVLFRINQNTGKLTPAGTVLDVPAPVCIVFVTAK